MFLGLTLELFLAVSCGWMETIQQEQAHSLQMEPRFQHGSINQEMEEMELLLEQLLHLRVEEE